MNIVANTPGETRASMMKWPTQEFLTQMQYLSDVWDAQEHDSKIRKLNNVN